MGLSIEQARKNAEKATELDTSIFTMIALFNILVGLAKQININQGLVVVIAVVIAMGAKHIIDEKIIKPRLGYFVSIPVFKKGRKENIYILLTLVCLGLSMFFTNLAEVALLWRILGVSVCSLFGLKLSLNLKKIDKNAAICTAILFGSIPLKAIFNNNFMEFLPLTIILVYSLVKILILVKKYPKINI